MNRALRNFCIAAAGLALIGACGGGSDDGGGQTGGIPVPASEPATITAANAPLIAGTVAEVAMGQGVFSSIFGSAGHEAGTVGRDEDGQPVAALCDELGSRKLRSFGHR
jgi:hypothetical protein